MNKEIKKKKIGIKYWQIIKDIALISVILVLVIKITKIENKIKDENVQIENEEISTLEIEPQRAKPEVISTNTWDLERVNIVNDTEGTPVPVPKGYVASSIDGENTIDTGFVIYEGEEAVTEENKVVAQKERNQWVWIPIYYPDEIYGRDANGAAHGKLYEYGYTGRTRLNWTMSNGVMKISNFDAIYKEPIKDSLSSTYMPDYLSEEGKEYNREFEEMIESVEKYGGFYIGRYETGSLSGEAKVVRGNTNISGQNWYTMKTKCKELQGTNENVITNMIWGSMWDATLEWLVDTGSKTYEEVGVDSSGWGNYSNSTVSGHGNKQETGYSEEWKANNIYDMAGNVYEWTQEVYYSSRAMHGGDFVGTYPAGARDRYNQANSNNRYGCRGALYVGV